MINKILNLKQKSKTYLRKSNVRDQITFQFLTVSEEFWVAFNVHETGTKILFSISNHIVKSFVFEVFLRSW